MKQNTQTTARERSIIKLCLMRQMERLTEDIKFSYTPDTVKPIRKMLRSELNKTKSIYHKF